jgi:hypothetical protein
MGQLHSNKKKSRLMNQRFSDSATTRLNEANSILDIISKLTDEFNTVGEIRATVAKELELKF